MMKRGLLLLLIFLGLLASSCYYYFIPSTRLAALLLTLGLSNQQLRPPTRWASISICWGGGWAVTIPLLLFSSSENAKVYGKRNFPYSEAAFYSSKLWGTQSEGKVVLSTLLNCGWSCLNFIGGGDLDNCDRPEKERGLKAGFLCQVLQYLVLSSRTYPQGGWRRSLV